MGAKKQSAKSVIVRKNNNKKAAPKAASKPSPKTVVQMANRVPAGPDLKDEAAEIAALEAKLAALKQKQPVTVAKAAPKAEPIEKKEPRALSLEDGFMLTSGNPIHELDKETVANFKYRIFMTKNQIQRFKSPKRDGEYFQRSAHMRKGCKGVLLHTVVAGKLRKFLAFNIEDIVDTDDGQIQALVNKQLERVK